MGELIKIEDNISASEKKQHIERLTLIYHIGEAAKVALDVSAGIYGHGSDTHQEVIHEAKQALEIYRLRYGDEATEQAYNQWYNDFGSLFMRIYSVMGNKLISIMENQPTEPQRVNFFEDLLNRIELSIFGESATPPKAIDDLLQLRANTNQRLTTGARQHLAMLPEYLNQNE